MTADIALRRAEIADVGFIMSVEQLPGYERFIGQWDAARHAEAMGLASNRYVLGLDARGTPQGFAILCDVDHASGNVLLHRIAVAEPGRGAGRALLVGVTDWVFRETQAFRLWFHMAADNARAHRVYNSMGFTCEGHLRQSLLMPDGSRGDALLFSMLKPEWPSNAASSTT